MFLLSATWHPLLIFLSWSPHISFLYNKSRKILCLIFRHFSPHSSPSTIIRLYIYNSLVHPILEYGTIIWDPSSSTLSHSLESIQLFALKIASRFRPLIPSLQSEFNLSSLASQLHKADIIFLFKLFHNIIVYFPSPILQPSFRPSYPLRSFHSNNFICPFSQKFPFIILALFLLPSISGTLPPPLSRKLYTSLSLFNSFH